MKNPDRSARMTDAERIVRRAEYCADVHEWTAADRLFREALALDDSASCRIAYGVCLAAQERFFEAISVFTPVLDSSHRAAVGVVCHNLAAIYRQVDDHDLARRFQWRATLLQDDAGPAELLGMANDAISSDHHEVAASLVTSAHEMSQDLNDLDLDESDHEDPDLVATMGLINATLHSPAEGLITLFAAYRRHQAAEDCRGMGIDLLNMSALFGAVNRHRAERSCLIRAIRCFEQVSAPHSCQRARQRLQLLDQMDKVRAFDVRRN